METIGDPRFKRTVAGLLRLKHRSRESLPQRIEEYPAIHHLRNYIDVRGPK